MERIIRELAMQLLQAGNSVILDFGLWAQSERDEVRTQAEAAGADFRMLVPDVTMETILEWLERRNASEDPHTFRIRRKDILQWVQWYEMPRRGDPCAVFFAPENACGQ